MTPAEIIPWLTLVLSSLAVLGHIKGWVNSGEKKLVEDLSAIRELVTRQQSKLTEHDRRIQTVESDVQHLPDKDKAHQLELAMEKLTGQIGILTERLKPIEATNERLNQLLADQAK